MQIRQIQQISESHCGPAVLAMLLDALDIEINQDDVVRAVHAEKTLEVHGMRIDQLGIACSKLAPQTSFWYKFFSSLDDIKYVLDHGQGVGVEWQGLFYDTEEEEEEHEDDDSSFGHYSIVSTIDEERKALIIVDPYKDFANQDRIFSIDTFLRRWWDTNEVRDPVSGRRKLVEDVRVMFFVTPKNEEWPVDRGFQRFLSEEFDSWFISTQQRPV